MILTEEFARVGFLRNMGEPYTNQIALLAQPREYAEGTDLFREGQDSPFVYLILTGKVSLEIEEASGRKTRVYTAGPGELVGWSPVLGCRAMTATARATTRARLAVLSVDRILALCERDPRFGMAFQRQIARVLSERLRQTRRCLARRNHRLPAAAKPRQSPRGVPLPA
jgi:CRP-like cAMP-binding protein